MEPRMFEDAIFPKNELVKLIREQEALLHKGEKLTLVDRREFQTRARRISLLLQRLRHGHPANRPWTDLN